MLILHGGSVVDGLGGDPYRADVVVEDDRIVGVHPLATGPPDSRDESVRLIDATDRFVLPGFVDVHAHDDLAVLSPTLTTPKVRQGVTLDVVGNCGHGCAPNDGTSALAAYSAPILGNFPPDACWPTFDAYLETLAAERRAVNVAALVPHGPLRAAVIGPVRRKATADEVRVMADLLFDALSAGAAGLSLGLMYSPGNAADHNELEALATVVQRHRKLLVAHLRNEGDRILHSIEEFATLGLYSGCALHVSHLKVTSPRNHGRMPEVLDALQRWRDRGVDITADIYPYVAGSTTAATLFPSWTTAEGLPTLLSVLRTQRDRVLHDLTRPWDELENYFLSLGPDLIHIGRAHV